MKQLWALIAALLGALLLALPAAAHQQKAAITTIEHNARTGLLEVIHRIPLHDAEQALRTQGANSADIVSDIESRRQFAIYVTDRFSITVDGELLMLTVLGSEIDGGNLVIYQEAPSPGIGTRLLVRSLVLTDVWPTQVNRVNVGPGNAPTTLIFRAGDPAKPVVLQ